MHQDEFLLQTMEDHEEALSEQLLHLHVHESYEIRISDIIEGMREAKDIRSEMMDNETLSSRYVDVSYIGIQITHVLNRVDTSRKPLSLKMQRGLR